MSFWRSSNIVARKEHVCTYCTKKIVKGEKYWREVGLWEGDFNNYCLCERCEALVRTYDAGEELRSLHDVLFDYELVLCPSCGSSNLREHEFAEDMMSVACECDECNEKWTEDLSLGGIKEMIRRAS